MNRIIEYYKSKFWELSRKGLKANPLKYSPIKWKYPPLKFAEEYCQAEKEFMEEFLRGE